MLSSNATAPERGKHAEQVSVTVLTRVVPSLVATFSSTQLFIKTQYDQMKKVSSLTKMTYSQYIKIMKHALQEMKRRLNF